LVVALSYIILLHGALEVLPTSATQKEVTALYETLTSLSLVAAAYSVKLARTWRVFRLAMGAVETVQGRYSVKKVFNFWTSQLRLAVYATEAIPAVMHPEPPLSSISPAQAHQLRIQATSFQQFCIMVTRSDESRVKEDAVAADELGRLLGCVQSYAVDLRKLEMACRDPGTLNALSSPAPPRGPPFACPTTGCSSRIPSHSGICTVCATAVPNAWRCRCNGIYNSETATCIQRWCVRSRSLGAPPTPQNIQDAVRSIAATRLRNIQNGN